MITEHDSSLCPLQVDPARLRKLLRTVVMNQVLISGPMVVGVYHLMSWSADPCRAELPSFQRALAELAVFSGLEEVLFYYSHRYESPAAHRAAPEGP